MGHPKSEFETMMMTLACGPKGPGLEKKMGSPVLDLGKAMTETLTAIKRSETHCFELAHEFLKSKSGNFTQTDLFYDVDGFVVKYHCSRDDRTYTVKITASKEPCSNCGGVDEHHPVC